MNKMIGVMAGAALLSAATVGAASGNGLSGTCPLIRQRRPRPSWGG